MDISFLSEELDCFKIEINPPHSTTRLLRGGCIGDLELMSSCLLANYKRRRSWARDLKPKSYELINRVGYCFKLVAKADLLMVGMLVVGCAAPRGLAQPPLPALNVKRPSQMPLPCPMKTLMEIKNIFEKLL